MTNRYSALFLALAVGVLAPGGPLAAQEQNTPVRNDPGKDARVHLLGEIKAVESSDYRTLAVDPEFSRKILLWKLQSLTSPEKLTSMAAQRDVLLRANFLNDVDWLAGFVNSGQIPNADKALENLSFLCGKDAAIATHPLYKKLATATALEFAKNYDPKKESSAWNDPGQLWARYNYYRSSYDRGLLNPQFARLDYWDMRIVVRTAPTGWGSVESLTWQRDNVRLPAQSYTGACWQAPYRRYNQIGEIIHGRDYYVPFQGVYSCQAEMVKDVGAVCGGLSTFGAHAAVANGVPAFTMGEPGHCAYTVRTTMTDWKPAYSLSWKRGTHFQSYGNKWSHLILYQDNYGDKARFLLASKLRWMAELADLEGEKELVRNLYQQALIAQARNLTNWRNYLDWEKQQNSLGREQWSNFNSQICKTFGPDYPELCWELLSQKVYPKLFSYEATAQQKLEEVSKFHASIDMMKPAQWDYPAALDYQFGFVGHDGLVPMVSMLVKKHLTSGGYGGASLSWCYSQVSGEPGLQKQFFDIVAQNSKGAEAADGALTTLAGNIMVEAEKNGDIDSFQAAGRLVKDKFTNRLPKFEPFPGTLLSSGGLLTMSSVHNRWGAPWMHWGVLEACGGDAFTKDDDPATATIMMPRIGVVKGLVIIPRSSGQKPGSNSDIEISMDGQNWTKIASIKKMQRVNRIDLKGNEAQAKYVRMIHKGKTSYQIQAFLVYGEKAS